MTGQSWKGELRRPAVDYSLDELRERLKEALQALIAYDGELLRVDANERSITHRMAIYLEPAFREEGWQVDVEYNRRGENKKLLPSCGPASVQTDDADGRTVYPDIVIHARGQRQNLLVIEVKKPPGQGDAEDICKLEHFTDMNGAYRYAWGLHLVLPNTSESNDYSLTWFQDRRQIG